MFLLNQLLNFQTIPVGASESQEIFHHQDLLESSSSKLEIPLDSLPEELRLQCEAQIQDLVTAISRELVIRKPSLQPRSLEVAKEDKSFSEQYRATFWICVSQIFLLLILKPVK